MKKKLILILCLILTLLIVSCGINEKTEKIIGGDDKPTDIVIKSDEDVKKEENKLISEFVVEDINGKKVSFKELQGQKVYIEFFATW